MITLKLCCPIFSWFLVCGWLLFSTSIVWVYVRCSTFCIDHESRCLLCLLLGQFNSHQILALCCSDMWHLFLLGRLQNLEKQHVSFFSVLFLSVKYAGQFGGICVVCVLHHWAGELRRGLSTEAVEWRGGVERAAAFRGGSGSSGRWEGILS